MFEFHTFGVILSIFAHRTAGCSFTLDYDYRYQEGKGIVENGTASDLFYEYVHTKQALVVYFDFRYRGDDGELVPFYQKIDDSFAPDVMTWAKDTGRNLLRLPLDASVLSFGILGIRSMHMEIVVMDSVKDCLDENTYSYDEYINKLMTFLLEDVARDSNISLSRSRGSKEVTTDLLCRPAYSFDYPPWGQKGIGFRCCNEDRNGRIVCNTSYSNGWEVIWWGPLAMMAWMYLLILVRIIKTFKKSRDSRKAIKQLREEQRKKENEKKLSNKLAATISRSKLKTTGSGLAKLKAASNLAMMQKETELFRFESSEKAATSESGVLMETANILKSEVEVMLLERTTAALNFTDPKMISRHEKITILDVLGLSHKLQEIFKRYQKIISVGSVVVIYYIVFGFITWQYSKLSFLFFYTRDSLEMFINVFGHLGWLFTNPDYWIFSYAIFEAVITFSLPFMVLYVYLALTFYRPRSLVENAPSENTDDKLADRSTDTEAGKKETIFKQEQEGKVPQSKVEAPRKYLTTADNWPAGMLQDMQNTKKFNRTKKGPLKVRPVHPEEEPESGVEEHSLEIRDNSMFNQNKESQQTKNTHNEGGNTNQNNSQEDSDFDSKDEVDEAPTSKLKQQTIDRLTRFFSTFGARIIGLIFAVISLLYVLLVLGPFIAYVAFFNAFAMFVNVNVVTPWLLPITLCLNYVYKVFDPAIEIYVSARNEFFNVAKELDAKEILKEDEATGQVFIPRDVFDTFFKKQSRDLIFKTLGNIVKVIGMTSLLIIVTLALQYPMHLQSEDTTTHLGMQMLFIVPLLGKVAGGQGMGEEAKAFMRAAIKMFIKEYLSDIRQESSRAIEENQND